MRSVRPSPARLEAPEPHVWLPLLDLTAEFDAQELSAELEDLDLDDELETLDVDRDGAVSLDITEELELLVLVEGQDDLARKLEAIEAGFWRTAEAEHPFLTGELPVTRVVEPTVEAQDPHPSPVVATPAGLEESATVASAALAAPAPAVLVAASVDPPTESNESMIPPAYASVRPNRPAIVHRKRTLRMRRRIIVTVLVTAVAAACAGVTARVLHGTRPQRDVTVSIDGQANTVVTRAGTVSDLLAAGGVVLHDGDRVVPSLSTQLRQGMPISIRRAFPIVVDVDGKVTARRTTRHTIAGLRHELGLPAALTRVGAGRIGRRSRVVMRTPHDVTLMADAVTTPIPHSTALTVAELLAGRKIALGPQDEVTPAIATRLTPGLVVQVFRLAPGQVSEERIIPFTTEYHDDPNLARGHTTTIQAGKNGTARVVSNVVRKDGVIIQWTEVSNTVTVPPVTQILARGTKPSGSQKPPPAPVPTSGGVRQSGSASWYDSHAGSGSCAHLSLPFGTIVTIRNTANGRTAQCRVGDRGPMAYTGHIIDLNRDVFAQLAPLGTGVIPVQLSW